MTYGFQQPNPYSCGCGHNTGTGLIAIILVVFLLLIICCSCCGGFNRCRDGIGL